MGRILSIDYGRKRTGIAVTDPLQIIAQGLTTVPTAELSAFLKDYVGREKVDRFVIGRPMQPNGKPSENLKRVEAFANSLQRLFPDIPLTWWDERYTSVLAHQTMRDAGLSKMKRRDKALVDEISATIILQSYMEAQQNGIF